MKIISRNNGILTEILTVEKSFGPSMIKLTIFSSYILNLHIILSYLANLESWFPSKLSTYKYVCLKCPLYDAFDTNIYRIFEFVGSRLCAADVQKPAPNFEGVAVVDKDFKTIKLSDYKGKYLVLFFYPLDL